MESRNPIAKSLSFSNDSKTSTNENSPGPCESSEQMSHTSHEEPNLTLNLSNSVAAMSPPSLPPMPEEDPQVADPEEEDREYDCKYCNKKFTNKQALGGHQNAHKFERAMEKTAPEMQGTHFGYFGGPSSYSGLMAAVPPFTGSLNRSLDFLNRNVANRPYILHPPFNFPRPVVPIGPEFYNSGPVLRPNQTYLGQTAPMQPRFSQFMMPAPTYVPNRDMTRNFMHPEPQGSSSTSPATEGSPNFVGSTLLTLGRNTGGRNNNGHENQLDDDAGLDLSLRL